MELELIRSCSYTKIGLRMVKLLVLSLCAVLVITSAAQTGHQRHNVDDETGNEPTIKGSTKVVATSSATPTQGLPTEVAPTKEAPTKATPTKAQPTDQPKPTDSTPTKASPSNPTKSTDPTPTKVTPSNPTKPTDPTPTKVTPSNPTKPTDPTPTKASPSTPTPSTPPAPTVAPTPPHCKPGQKKTINGSCRDYVECDKSFQWVQKSCTTFCQVFDATKSRCVWNWQSPCLKPPTTVDPPSSPEPSTPSPGTTPQPSGSSTSEPITSTTPTGECTNGDTKPFQKGDCKNYLECDSNQWVKKTCSKFYDYDVNKKSCTWNWWAKCYT